MTPQEAAAVLAKAAGYDTRIRATDATVLAWSEALSYIPLSYGLDAVARYYATPAAPGTQLQTVTTAHVLYLAEEIRRERVRERRERAQWEASQAQQIGQQARMLGGPGTFAEALDVPTDCKPESELDPGEWARRLALHKANNPGKTPADRLDPAGRGPAAAAAVEAIRRMLPTGKPLNRAGRRRNR